MGESHIPMALAGICTVGGLMGYLKSRSMISLVAGAGVGALYAAAGFMIKNGDAENGHAMGLGTSLLLAGMMGRRFGATGKFMPAGGMAVMGVSGAVYHGLKLREWKQW